MPFQITTQPFGTLPDATTPLTEYILEHPESGEFATVIPGYGGVLHRLFLRKGNHVFSVVKATESPQALVADEGYTSALLYPFPSRIRHGIYQFDGEEYALKMNETNRDNAMHGFVHGQAFSVVSQETTATYAQLVIRYDHHVGDTAGYPFPFALTVTYELLLAGSLPNGNNAANDKLCALRISYSAQNTGFTRCPAAFGWHPYFTLSNESVDDMSLSLPGRAAIELDEKMLPVGRKPVEQAETIHLKDRQLDTAFVLEPAFSSDQSEPFTETVLTSLNTGLRLVVGQQTGEGKLNYLVCYTPARRDSIAIEPLTANVDAFNNGDGLAILDPGDTLSGTMWVRLD